MKSVSELREEGAGQKAEPRGAAAGPEPASDGATTGTGGEAPTEEEQTAYTQVVLAATEVIYDEKTHGAIMQMLQQQAEQPAQALGQAASMILVELDQQANGTIPEEVLLPSLTEIVEQLGQVADAAGVFPVDEALLNQGLAVAVEEVAVQYDVEEEDIREFMASIPEEEIQAARAQAEQYGLHQMGGGGPAPGGPAAAPAGPGAPPAGPGGVA